MCHWKTRKCFGNVRVGGSGTREGWADFRKCGHVLFFIFPSLSWPAGIPDFALLIATPIQPFLQRLHKRPGPSDVGDIDLDNQASHRTAPIGHPSVNPTMEFLEVPLFDDDIFKLLVRFSIDLVFLSLIVVFAIYPNQREREFAFTAVMLNVIVFFICFTMKKLELDLGLALGLFAVFGVLRYRTDALRPKEMTYLFIVIGIAVINSLANKKTSYAEIALVNALIFATAMLKEWIVGRVPGQINGSNDSKGNKASEVTATNGNQGKKNGSSKNSCKHSIEYDRLEWLGNEHRNTLLADLRERTGLDVLKAEIKTVDLLQNKATLTIWTTPPTAE